MAKAKKITKEELAAVQGAMNNINNLYMNVGRAIVDVIKNAGSLDMLDAALKEQQKYLEDKLRAQYEQRERQERDSWG